MWALMGASTFLGLRYGVWDDADNVGDIAQAAADLMINGLAPRPKKTALKLTAGRTNMGVDLVDITAKRAALTPHRPALST